MTPIKVLQIITVAAERLEPLVVRSLPKSAATRYIALATTAAIALLLFGLQLM